MPWSDLLAVGYLAGSLQILLVWILFRSMFSPALICSLLGVTSLAALGLIGAASGEISFFQAIVVVAFGSAALTAATFAIERLAKGDTIEMQSHWGGLGGVLGGWRLSPTASLLLVALVFAGGAAGVVAARDKGERLDKKSVTADAGNKDAGSKEAGNKDAAGTAAPPPKPEMK
jgi:hypothetical protein